MALGRVCALCVNAVCVCPGARWCEVLRLSVFEAAVWQRRLRVREQHAHARQLGVYRV